MIFINLLIFRVQVETNNKGSKDYDITMMLRVDSMLYTGSVQGNVKKQEFHASIPAQTSRFFKFFLNNDN